MISQSQIDQAISRGIEYLGSEQDDAGSFKSLSSLDKKFSSHSIRHSVFNVSLIALAMADNPGAAPILDKISEYLLSQKSDNWSFNYWDRKTEEYASDNYPDDLDDTACAMAALYKINPDAVNGEALAKVVSTLTLLEIKEGGPYRTWLVPKSAPKIWQDVDPAVNSNTAYFLSLLDVRLPNINKLIDASISHGKISSPYYASDIAVIYFISRFYQGKLQGGLIRTLKSKIRGQDQNYMELALSVTALLSLGCPGGEPTVADSIKILLNKTLENNWQPFPLVIEKVSSKKICYSGSPTLTCAFVLEALFRYKKELNPKTDSAEKHREETFKAIIDQAKRQFPNVNPALKKAFVGIVEKVASREIVLFPQFFASSLHEEKITASFLARLSLANLYGWIAYSIYDDFLDQEGDPPKLAIANICLRRLDEIFQTILPRKYGFYPLAKTFLDQIDTANYWETTCCRANSGNKIAKKELPKFTDLSKLAEKSIGHALGPIAILYLLGLDRSSNETVAFIAFAKNYLIARQLNDDAHDWEEDMRHGHISFPVAQVVNDSGQLELEVETETDFLKLRTIFWGCTIQKVCQEIIKHTDLARECLNKISIISDK